MPMYGERDQEFANLREKENLEGFDKELYNLLTPNPNHNKSVNLISTGANILSNYKVRPDHDIEILEERYLNKSSLGHYGTNPYSNGLDRSIVLK